MVAITRLGRVGGITVGLVVAACSAIGQGGTSPSAAPPASLPNASPPVATASPSPSPTPEATPQWWVDTNGEPNHEVRPLASDAPPAQFTRDQAIALARGYLGITGEPTVVAHGLTEVMPGVWKSAWVFVERYENASPGPISGPCCSPHYAVLSVAGVAYSDQTGEFLIGWQTGTSVPGPTSEEPTSGPSREPATTTDPSPSPRPITTGELTWSVVCHATTDSDCDGAVGLFANNLARSWKDIFDESGGRLTLEPRPCPTFNGLTASECWDVTAVRPSGPFCMVVAHGANDARYPAFFEIGGLDGAGRATGPPKGWPMCLGLPNDGHTGDPVTYAGGSPQPRAPLTPAAAATQVMKGLSGDPQLTGITTTSTPSGLDVAVTLSRNNDRVPDVWLADLAVGAVAELVHSDQAVANDLISRATAVGPGEKGDPITTNLGVGAVRLGEVFGSPNDSMLAAHVADVAKQHGLEVADLQILHPLESALRVKLVVSKGATIDWTIDELRTALVGQPPDVEGILIELDDSDGQTLLQSGAAYRTGEGGLWFAPGQDERFGAVHGGTPGH